MRLGGVLLPLVGRARVYACGITPYDVTHLGHAATFVWTDTLCRVLRAGGAEVILSRNVTDVDDVLLAAAGRAGEPYDRFAAIQQFYFEQDMAALGVGPPSAVPRAHAYIGQFIALAGGLLAQGAAYERDGRVYFRGAAAAHRAVPDEAAALRLASEYGDDPDDPRKDDPFDVAVWQTVQPGDPAWESPWGPGRPGWHAECAAMALHTFGPALDVQAGGGDVNLVLTVAEGKARLGLDPAGTVGATATIVLGYAEALAMARGELDPADALAAGRVRIRGDLAALVAGQDVLAVAAARLGTDLEGLTDPPAPAP